MGYLVAILNSWINPSVKRKGFYQKFYKCNSCGQAIIPDIIYICPIKGHFHRVCKDCSINPKLLHLACATLPPFDVELVWKDIEESDERMRYLRGMWEGVKVLWYAFVKGKKVGP